jgi:molybdopterin-binding protein
MRDETKPWGANKMKVGARNRIVGKVTQIKKGSVMSIVKVAIPASSNMASVMTIESLKELGIKKGDKVEVVVKAVNVLLIRN